MLIYPNFIKKIDILICVFTLVTGIIISLLYLKSQTIQLLTIGGSLVFASVLSLLIHNNLTSVKTPEILKQNQIVLEIIYFILFALSILVLFLSMLERPFLYFILISVCAGVLAISIFYSNTKRSNLLQIFKILILSLNLKYSIYLNYSLVGIDSIQHTKMNDQLALAGDISVLWGKEVSFPLMHINVAINQIVSGLPIHESSNFAIILPFVISSICVYLFARKFFDEKIALFSLLILNMSDYIIYWGSAPQTTTYGICLYYFLLFIISNFFIQKPSSQWMILLLIFIPSLILSHGVSSFIFLVTICGLYLGYKLYQHVFEKETFIFPILIIFITGIGLLQHWFMAIYRAEGSSFFDSIGTTLNYYIMDKASLLNRPESYSHYTQILPPFIERFLNVFGFSLLIFFAILGSLLLFKPIFRNKVNFSIVICTALLLTITLIFPFFGIQNIVPTRWFAFEYFILSILAAFSIIQISNPLKKNGISLIVIIVVVITFFMIVDTTSNLDSPIWLKSSTVSTSYTIPEVKGATTLSHYSSNITGDSRFGYSVLVEYLEFNELDFNTFTEGSNFDNSIFLWRKYMVEKPIRTRKILEGYGGLVDVNIILGQNFFNSFERKNKIYDNSQLSGYFITKK